MPSSTSEPHHSTRALSLARNGDGDRFLDLTLSVMVEWNGHHMPMVLAIDEECETLFDDIQNVYAKTNDAKERKRKNDDSKKKHMKVVWGQGFYKDVTEESVLDDSNMVATLRLLKSRNGADLIATSDDID